MAYKAPHQEVMFVLEELCSLSDLSELPGLEDATPDMVSAIIEEAGKFAEQELSPLNRIGDEVGLGYKDGEVSTPDGWKRIYQALVDMGWNSPTSGPDHGGMGLPAAVNASIQEMFNGANISFQMASMLTQGAIEAIEEYASDGLKETFLPNLVAGTWSGTMNLTEPQAGSDLALIRTKAEPEGDHYRVSGQKIFISYGEHDLTENIIHLVLARLPDAPEGVRGISLFVVPKFLVNQDGSLGERNDVRCVSIEHKLGIHASPTCSLSFGDNGGAVGYLVGEPHHGLQYMFAMMNAARLLVGLQGVGVAERSLQEAFAYATDRKQGSRPGVEGTAAIVEHHDVRRMLGMMNARTQASRGLAYRAAASQDRANRTVNKDERLQHQRRLDLMIPIVKGWATESSVITTSTGVQIHGGMGFIEETGVAQHLRDSRILTIYEGTTGIQALDLIGRKILRDKGQAVSELLEDMRRTLTALKAAPDARVDWVALEQMLQKAISSIEEVVQWILTREAPSEAEAAATSILELFGICTGAWVMTDTALAAARRLASGETNEFLNAKLQIAEFYCGQVFPQSEASRLSILNGSRSVINLSLGALGAEI